MADLRLEILGWLIDKKLNKKEAANLLGIEATTFNRYINQKTGKRHNPARIEEKLQPVFAAIMQEQGYGKTAAKPSIGFAMCSGEGVETPETQDYETTPIGFGLNTKTAGIDPELQIALKKYMDEEGVSANQISKMLPVSAGALSLWFDGKYKGDNEKINKAVKAFLSRQQQIIVMPDRELCFEETTASRIIMDVARLCHVNGEVGVITGEAGLGKTVAIKEYVKQNPDVILIEVDPECSSNTLLRAIGKKIGVPGSTNTQLILDEIIDKLTGSKRLIILDEAEEVEYDGLNRLRRIYDKAGIGILLIGMPRLIHNLRGRKAEYTQLYSRNTIAVQIGVLELDDTEKLVKQVLPDLSKSLIKAFHNHCKQNARVLKHLLFNALKVTRTSGKELDVDIIEKLARYLIYR